MLADSWHKMVQISWCSSAKVPFSALFLLSRKEFETSIGKCGTCATVQLRMQRTLHEHMIHQKDGFNSGTSNLFPPELYSKKVQRLFHFMARTLASICVWRRPNPDSARHHQKLIGIGNYLVAAPQCDPVQHQVPESAYAGLTLTLRRWGTNWEGQRFSKWRYLGLSRILRGLKPADLRL